VEFVASRLEEYVLDVIAEPGKPGRAASFVRAFLSGCAGLYDFGLEAYLASERWGLRRRDRLPVPVLCVGNLTVGGTGKTPMTQYLCRCLQAQGKRVAILSRGHGGESQSVRLVSGQAGPVLLSAPEAGDEPVLLARTLRGVPVLVGKDRRLSGREALRRFGLDALVLDDGFQFWQLYRDLDIVLLDACRPFGNGFPLPRGLLREPKRHLRRAGMIVATRAGRLTASEREHLTTQIRVLAPDAPLFFADHRAVGVAPAADPSASLLPLSALTGKRIFAVSAIAQPQSFWETLTREAHAQVAGCQVWDDHYKIGLEDAQIVIGAAQSVGAEALVMTEKDAVKWPVSAEVGRAELDGLPVYALRIEMAVENEDEFLREVMARLG
jgi:tetraacyldisaccharide 4'-kinase